MCAKKSWSGVSVSCVCVCVREREGECESVGWCTAQPYGIKTRKRVKERTPT